MRFQIPEPCNADWDKMKIGLRSRHCENCNKNVIDFRGQSKVEILLYLIENKGKRTCGRFHTSQFDYIQLEELITISALRQLPKSNRFAVLAVACMLLASCTTDGNPANNANLSSKDAVVSIVDTVHTSAILHDSISQSTDTISKAPIPAPIDPIGMIEMGEVIEPWPIDTMIEKPEPVLYSNGVIDLGRVYEFVEVMPEFPGGMDSLFLFINTNLTYPKIAREAEIEGKVYARFVVETDGNISNPEILKSVPGPNNFNEEVLRVISKMPKWTPGLQRGQAVRAYFTIPFSFRLN